MIQRTSDERPDPEALLARARKADAAKTRGKLRIYFGASAGVGKTFAMLTAGRRLLDEGHDVLVGIVETHGRAETQALLTPVAGGASLAVAPRARLERDGRTYEEFDLDAILARRPELVLVDELAHTNAPGSRHAKRWQDVEELLAAGLDVFTTLNVQHLESLNDIVGGITGIRVQETLPDTFFDAADEVVLVDVTADELLKRLAAGKVYVAHQAERAARNFFRRGNLIALREIALRRTADRIEDDVQSYRDERAIERVWGTEAALLCCIGPDAEAERVVRAAARLAVQLDVEWQAIYVETPRLQRRASAERERILKVVSLAQQLGAETSIVAGSDVAEAIAGHARRQNLSRIVLGRARPEALFARLLLRPALAARLATAAPEVTLVVVGLAEGTPDPEPAVPRRAVDEEQRDDDKTMRQRWRYALAAATIVGVTLVAWVAASWLHPTNIAMLYLLAVTIVAIRMGRRPAILSALAAVAAFDFFFVPPRFSFAVADAQYVVTLGTMLTIAIVIGTLASNLRYQARVAAHREQRAHALYEIARELSRALRTDDVVTHVQKALGAMFRADVHVLLPEGDALPTDRRLAIDRALAGSAEFEPAIAQWVFEHAQPAGAGTDTLAGSAWLFLPLQTPMAARGVLALRPARRRLLLIPEQRRLLETLATLVGIAIERVHYVEVAQGAVLKSESERLRNSILSALSHDLRTPIAALGGLAETLAMSDLGADDVALVDGIRGEVRRMSLLVENLLDMARIESGAIELRRGWHAIEETIGTALAATRRELAGRTVTTRVPAGLPLVEYDAVLIERVVCNLLENAAKHARPGATVTVEAKAERDTLTFAVEDDGPGLPPGFDSPERIETLFAKFARGVKESSASGVGLGLAICRAIVEAHGGSIRVEPARQPSTAGRGFRIVVTLPRRAPPSMEGAGADGDAAEVDAAASLQLETSR